MAAKEENRCWPGYEPVPGKKPYSKGSCRPEDESKARASEKAKPAVKKKATKKKTGGGKSTSRKAAAKRDA